MKCKLKRVRGPRLQPPVTSYVFSFCWHLLLHCHYNLSYNLQYLQYMRQDMLHNEMHDTFGGRLYVWLGLVLVHLIIEQIVPCVRNVIGAEISGKLANPTKTL